MRHPAAGARHGAHPASHETRHAHEQALIDKGYVPVRQLTGPVIGIWGDAHIRLAAPAENGGVRILRRGYSYTDGIDPLTGELDAGLFFVCFQRDPERQFAALQRRLGSVDALREYIRHTSSAVFAIPPGTAKGGHVADGLFA